MKSQEQKVGVWAVYRQMLRSCPGLGWRLAAQSAVLMLGRACVAWGALLVASAVDERASAEAAVAGAAGLYAACRALEWFLGCLHSRMHASGALPAAFEFCDQAVEAALSDPEPGVDPARLAKRMDQKAQARAALGFLFHHIAPPAFELAICSVALSRLGFGWLAWALAPAAAAHMWLAVSLSPKIKALAAKALGGAEASQAMASQAFESAALARSYGSQGVLAKMLREQSARELKAFKRQSLASEAALAVGSLALAGWAALFFGAGLCFVRAGEASPGAFAALAGVSGSIFGQLKTLAFAFDGLLSSTAALGGHARALSNRRSPAGAPTPCEAGELELLDWRAMRGGEVKASVSRLSLNKGECLFLVGASGAGKSTLLLSLLGGCESLGSMRWAGEPWQPGRPGVCAHMPQEGSAIEGTVAQNLRLGRPLATHDEMWDALGRARLRERVEALGGLDAPLDWRGSSLSGGEIQRLSFARAWISGMPLMLLDEPTSALDALAEAAMLREVAASGRSAIVCVHRIRAIARGSRVALMNQGRIAEEGLLEDLIERGGEFARLWAASQAD